MITYAQFISDIPSLGTYWSREKHAKDWEIKESGSWFVLTQTSTGRKHRLPITSVSFITEMPAPETKKGKE